MGFIKYFDLPEKEPGEPLNTADRAYLIKLILAAILCGVCLTILGVQLVLERHIHRMDKSAKALKEWSKKADFANEMLSDMFRVQKQKEAYQNQGIGAEEAKDINHKKEDLK